MNDKELLELSAKAAGFKFNSDTEVDGLWASIYPNNCWGIWNPLTDDGSALRLAVKLHLEIAIHETLTGVINGNLLTGIEEHNDDPYSATRRAIVLASAEIGKRL